MHQPHPDPASKHWEIIDAFRGRVWRTKFTIFRFEIP
jgi:hypothetical protein